MNSNTAFLTLARQWDRLEPAVDPEGARTKHVKLPPSISYPAGQILGPVTATPGRYAAPGVGVGNANHLLEYPCTTDASGFVSLGTTSRADDTKFESVPAYYQGKFFLKDLTGIGGDDTIMNQLGKLIQGTGRADTAAIIQIP
jgi:hypothetical protein